MNQSQRFIVNTPKVVHEKIDGEVVIVNLNKGDYFSLVKTGADIWEKITKGISQGAILEEMIHSYKESPETLENAVNEFIAQLQQEELIALDLTEELQNSEIPTSISSIEKLEFELPTLQKYTDMEELLALDPIHEVDDAAGWPNAKMTA